MALRGQIWTLTRKNLKIALERHLFSTILRAFVLPIAFIAFLSYARNLFVPPALFGIGDPHPVRSLQQGLDASGGGREKVVFVNSGFSGGDIDHVIDILSESVTAAGKTALRTSNPDDLLTVCKSSLRGATECYGAVVFTSSPTEGDGGLWNYTLRADGALGIKLDVTVDTNDIEIYLLPMQHAVDFAIASVNGTIDQTALPTQVMEFVYTDETEEERETDIRVRYQSSIIDVLGVGFLIGMVGVTYHLTGLMASERELGMSQLIEAMMPNLRRWEPQLARFLSYHAAFTLMYLPSWIICAAILTQGVWTHSAAAVYLLHLATGLALVSWSILGGSFFKKSQLSGITVTLATLLLGVLAQVINKQLSAGGVVILSVLFTPCSYILFIMTMARYEHEDIGLNWVNSAPNNWPVPAIVMMAFLVLQIFAYPVIGFYVERYLYGTSSGGRTVVKDAIDSHNTVQLDGFTKHYPPNWFAQQASRFMKKKPETVVAVNDLTLSAGKGQILVLLGANGSGKSTTLDAIAGLNTITSGHITVDGTGGLGIAPQKNVLWDEITVEEHIRIFNRLKSTTGGDSKEDICSLVHAVDLAPKIKAYSKTLSGGQKRKLQLGMMFTGGSAVCCVDEVSSGLDPLSRRKIWDILLAERGSRTIILTTHFLDEADLLADRIAIMSKGTLRAEGSSVELKANLGGGYRVHLPSGPSHSAAPVIDGVQRDEAFDLITYYAGSSSGAARIIRELESKGIHDYQLAGPTIEDVFLKLAEEVHFEPAPVENSIEPVVAKPAEVEKHAESVHSEESPSSEGTAEKTARAIVSPAGLNLLSGKEIGFTRQTIVLFHKRLTILRRNFLPQLAALLTPVIAAGLVTLFIKSYDGAGCTPLESVSISTVYSLETVPPYDILVGPSERFTDARFDELYSPLLPDVTLNSTALSRITHKVNTTVEFEDYIDQFYANVTPGGSFAAVNEAPTLAYKGNDDLYDAIFAQNILDVAITNISISTQYSVFDIPWAPSTGDSLQLVTYFGLALAAYPAFFSLYPTIERNRNVRGLQYSNGVRSLPLWLAYLSFDFIVVLVSSALCVIIFAASSSVWYNVGYLFPILVLYGIASTLWAYVTSLFAKSQLSAFAIAAASQEILFLVYMIAYLCTITYAPVDKIDSDLLIVHYVVSVFTPMGSLIRAMFLTLNLFSTTCVGEELAPNPGGINQYGGPILYLFLQIFALFGLLLWYDSGSVLAWYRRIFKKTPPAEPEGAEFDLETTSEGLKLLHLTKTFGSYTAVDNVSFAVPHGEVFALLGPNGAGKSTTISLIRGDIQPSKNGGEVFVEAVPISKHRAKARSHLGVCPQFDAIDQMTVVEHLQFYARVRGVSDIDYNVNEVINAVGLQNFATRMAGALSGGNKRKLSLGIALMGNPTVLLLDEPSSGMDAASKRVMWRTLANIVRGRSLLLTTHSMEEANALATRAGILARRMLAMGTIEELRHTHANAFYVHLVMKSAPFTTAEETDTARRSMEAAFPGAIFETQAFHGQMRFAIPAAPTDDQGTYESPPDAKQSTAVTEEQISIGDIIMKLETLKEQLTSDGLDIEHYSCSPTTLDQVFLSIVQKHNVQEENSGETTKPWWRRSLWSLVMRR